MEIEVDNRKYEVLIATDDKGARCELWDLGDNRHLIDIFKNEQTKTIGFYSAEMTIPFWVVEKVLQHFYSQIGTELNN